MTRDELRRLRRNGCRPSTSVERIEFNPAPGVVAWVRRAQEARGIACFVAGKVAIEHRANEPHIGPRRFGHADQAAGARDDAVVGVAIELRSKRARKMLETDAPSRADRIEIDLEIAHQPLDDRCAQAVVVVEREPFTMANLPASMARL